MFLALDLQSQREVTVKIFDAMKRPLEARLRYQGLVAAAFAVNHPAVVLPRVQIDLLGEPPIIVVDALVGADLGASLHGARLAWPRAVQIAQDCVGALTALAEATDAAHRALKPGNVWICSDGQVLILDFGVAELGVQPVPVREDGTAVEYRAPEQIEGQPGDSRSDVFAIGVLLAEMVTGVNPFAAASPAEAAENVLSSLPWSTSLAAPSAAIPAVLGALIGRMLARDPDERFANAEELGHHLGLARRTAESVVRASPLRLPQRPVYYDEHSTSLFLPIGRPLRVAASVTFEPQPAPPTPPREDGPPPLSAAPTPLPSSLAPVPQEATPLLIGGAVRPATERHSAFLSDSPTEVLSQSRPPGRSAVKGQSQVPISMIEGPTEVLPPSRTRNRSTVDATEVVPLVSQAVREEPPQSRAPARGSARLSTLTPPVSATETLAHEPVPQSPEQRKDSEPTTAERPNEQTSPGRQPGPPSSTRKPWIAPLLVGLNVILMLALVTLIAWFAAQ